ncbi:hypothetical protein [Streptomyces sp. V1I1]|uniref:hypothetical protein n=1 Tax=Streptomyces sp. V1I1 TaxID=3042272 RepID=UPI0027883CA1|nr:hypothetical protein [Streptomyces sp. V1I1]MDQ0946034.1 ABC-type multidrug transport system permease subunit [Streptomyces sp. V1I1]
MSRFFIFLIRVQWIDRLATSSFLIGITVQTALLTLALYHAAENQQTVMVFATRASLLTCTSIVLLSAMSNIQNEFRYGTIERVLLGKVPFSRLLAVRSASAAIVASPAIVVPFIGAVARFPDMLTPRTVLLVAMVYIFLGSLCYQATLVLCQFRNAASMVPWIRMVLLFLGLSVIPFEGSEAVSLLLPTGWMLRFAEAGSTEQALLFLAAFLLVTLTWTGGIWKAFGARSMKVVEKNMTDGAEAT